MDRKPSIKLYEEVSDRGTINFIPTDEAIKALAETYNIDLNLLKDIIDRYAPSFIMNLTASIWDEDDKNEAIKTKSGAIFPYDHDDL
jgi:hypothetical protein